MTSFFDFREQMAKEAKAAKVPPAPPSDDAAAKALTVSQVSAMIDGAMKKHLPPRILVKGELSNYHAHGGSGHLYFTLKDASSCLDCVMFKSDAARLKFTPEDGMELLAGGRIGVYAARGRYQLYTTSLQPLGQGALELAFRQLKEKLEREGLFEVERKRPLPAYPLTIALITSTETAALRDMLKVLGRYPFLRRIVCHVPVQGAGAGEQIADLLRFLNRASTRLGIDLILLGRGGGSLEDLWAFNEEVAARAIAASKIPIITGIGHEVDVSIADLVADYHAHTPTEAAQVAVAQWRTVRDVLDGQGHRIRRAVAAMVGDARQRLSSIERHEFFRRPMDRINGLRQLLDDRQRSLALSVGARLRRQQQRIANLATGMDSHHPRLRLALAGQRVNADGLRLGTAMRTQLAATQSRLTALASHLEAISPPSVLRRGYSMTTLKNGQLIRSSEQVKEGDVLLTRLADGQIESVARDSKQGRLFE